MSYQFMNNNGSFVISQNSYCMDWIIPGILGAYGLFWICKTPLFHGQNHALTSFEVFMFSFFSKYSYIYVRDFIVTEKKYIDNVSCFLCSAVLPWQNWGTYLGSSISNRYWSSTEAQYSLLFKTKHISYKRCLSPRNWFSSWCCHSWKGE